MDQKIVRLLSCTFCTVTRSPWQQWWHYWYGLRWTWTTRHVVFRQPKPISSPHVIYQPSKTGNLKSKLAKVFLSAMYVASVVSYIFQAGPKSRVSWPSLGPQPNKWINITCQGSGYLVKQQVHLVLHIISRPPKCSLCGSRSLCPLSLCPLSLCHLSLLSWFPHSMSSMCSELLVLYQPVRLGFSEKVSTRMAVVWLASQGIP